MAEPVVSFRNITKVFPGVNALTNVSIDLYEGEVLALMARTARASPRSSSA